MIKADIRHQDLDLRQALLPTLALGLMLLLLTPELEMVRDFASHAGLGLLVGVPLAAMLIPPALEAGDAMARPAMLRERHEDVFVGLYDVDVYMSYTPL